jgi:hypothetical protein
MTREEFLATIDERNALRAPAHVPLIDTPSALATWEVFRKAEAYDRFFQAHVKLHTQHLRQVPKNDDVALYQVYAGVWRKHRPEIDKQWAAMLEDGSWEGWAV